jgi:hypothetical protein
MTKVSIGFRGWRFDEDEVFDDDGNYRPLDEMSEDTRDRLGRIPMLTDQPCDVCYLEHGSADAAAADAPTVVYGEPGAEVLTCDRHEREFYYWFLEAGGREHKGTEQLQDAFHEWIAAGNRAPEGYDGPEHVETDPESVPAPAFDDLTAVDVDLPEDEQARLDLLDRDEINDEDLDLDMDAEYPSGDE